MSNVLDNISIPLHEGIELALDFISAKRNGKDVTIPYLQSAPGAGKTQLLSWFLESVKKYGLIACTPAIERNEKFGGIPNFELVNDEEYGDQLNTIWSVPEIISLAREKSKKYEEVILFLDDFHLCNSEKQSIFFEFFTHKKLGKHKLPENVSFILAGNTTAIAGAKTQLTAIRDRCTEIPVYADVDFWIKNYAIPKNLHSSGISFFEMDNNKIYFHEKETASEKFASPRSWTSLFNMIGVLEEKNDIIPNNILTVNVVGTVGKNAGARFLEYYKIFKSIDIKKIFETGSYILPKDKLIDMYAFTAALTNEFISKINKNPNDKCSCDLFCKILKEVSISNLEIFQKNVNYISHIEQNNIIKFDGASIIRILLQHDSLDTEMINKLSRTQQILNYSLEGE